MKSPADLCTLLNAPVIAEDAPAFYSLRLRDYATLQRIFEARYGAIVRMATERLPAESARSLQAMADRHIAAGEFSWGGKTFSSACLSMSGFIVVLSLAIRGDATGMISKPGWQRHRMPALFAAGFTARKDDDADEEMESEKSSATDWMGIIRTLRRKSGLTLEQIGELTQEQFLFELGGATGEPWQVVERRRQYERMDEIRREFAIPLHTLESVPAAKLCMMLIACGIKRAEESEVKCAAKHYLDAVTSGRWKPKL